jgi:anti-sigma factor RsiW
MNRCPNQTDWVLYVAEEWPPEELRRLEEHLAACPACRREVQTLKRGLSALGALDRNTPMSAGAMDTLRRRLHAEAKEPIRPARVVGLWRMRWAAVAAAVLVGALVWSLLPGPQVTSPPFDNNSVVKITTGAGEKPPVTPPALKYKTDSVIQDELTDIAAGVEMLEFSDSLRAMEAAPVQPKAGDENYVPDVDEFLQYLESGMDA